jgi:integrase
MAELKNDTKSDYTIRNMEKFLTVLSRKCDLNEPKQVKTFIANHNASSNTKECYSYAYRKYCQHYKINAKIPFWKPEAKQIRLPTNEKLEMLISASSPTMATKLIISKEDGLRPVKVMNLKVKDIDLEQKILYPTTAKHGSAKALRISQRLKETLQEHIIRKNLKPEDKLFTGNVTLYGKNYRRMRNTLAEKLHDPTIKTIKLYDFRHFYGTMTYKKTDLIHTMQQMGHKRIETTMIYMHLADIPEDDEWISECVITKEERLKLINNGFTFVEQADGISYYRKRK